GVCPNESLIQRNMGHVHRRVSDAIHVDETRQTIRVPQKPIVKTSKLKCVTAEDHVTKRESTPPRGLTIGLHQLIECRGCLVKYGNALTRQQRQDLAWRTGD